MRKKTCFYNPRTSCTHVEVKNKFQIQIVLVNTQLYTAQQIWKLLTLPIDRYNILYLYLYHITLPYSDHWNPCIQILPFIFCILIFLLQFSAIFPPISSIFFLSYCILFVAYFYSFNLALIGSIFISRTVGKQHFTASCTV